MTVLGVLLAVVVFHGVGRPLRSRRLTTPDAADDPALTA
jgi:hypothetical protein